MKNENNASFFFVVFFVNHASRRACEVNHRTEFCESWGTSVLRLILNIYTCY